MEAKKVIHSAIEDHTTTVFPNDLNNYGTLFGGKVLEIGDRLAAIVAKRHSGSSCVTLGIDSVRFLAPAHQGDVLIFQASVNRAWNSSMEIGLKVYKEDLKTLRRIHIVSAYFTFVAINEAGEPTQVPLLLPETEAEKRRYQEADIRKHLRMKNMHTRIPPFSIR
ncbi:acyl-CoA thioesterase [Rhabdochlamydiaceae symbiont of Dictyostelium giganteum]|uniref:acyl-CoA thioesterase n=1 Tax=Rhabdochlamydiaceae symbiont of Dictyostelium giganteum TaxID=3342349 RepID=UPI00384E9AF0